MVNCELIRKITYERCIPVRNGQPRGIPERSPSPRPPDLFVFQLVNDAWPPRPSCPPEPRTSPRVESNRCCCSPLRSAASERRPIWNQSIRAALKSPGSSLKSLNAYQSTRSTQLTCSKFSPNPPTPAPAWWASTLDPGFLRQIDTELLEWRLKIPRRYENHVTSPLSWVSGKKRRPLSRRSGAPCSESRYGFIPFIPLPAGR